MGIIGRAAPEKKTVSSPGDDFENTIVDWINANAVPAGVGRQAVGKGQHQGRGSEYGGGGGKFHDGSLLLRGTRAAVPPIIRVGRIETQAIHTAVRRWPRSCQRPLQFAICDLAEAKNTQLQAPDRQPAILPAFANMRGLRSVKRDQRPDRDRGVLQETQHRGTL